MKIEISSVDSRAAAWVWEFFFGRTQRVRVGGQISKEVRLMSDVPQGSILGPLLFLAYVNYTLGDQLIPEAYSCKYLGIILPSLIR
jgi:hypothetical protein